MLALAALRSPNLAGVLTVPFIAVWLLDGFWKSRLLEGGASRFWIVDFAEWVVLPSVSLWLLHRSAVISGRDYGLAAPLGVKDVLVLVPLAVVTTFIANYFGGFVLGRILFGYTPGAFQLERALAALGPFWIVGTVYLSATAAVCESIFALSLPWLWFSRGGSVSRRKAISFAVAAAALFALGHWETGLANATGAFMFQLVAVWWYFRLRTLWPIIGAHFLIDLYWLWPPATVM